MVPTDARIIDCASCKAYVELGEIDVASGGHGVIYLQSVAFAPPINSRDKQGVRFAPQGLGELDHWRPRIQGWFDFCALKPIRHGCAFARLLRAQPHLPAIAKDLGPGDLAALDIAALRAHDHRATGDRLVFAGLEITENEDVAGLELDHLAVANIIHEMNINGVAFDILDQRSWNQWSWSLR